MIIIMVMVFILVVLVPMKENINVVFVKEKVNIVWFLVIFMKANLKMVYFMVQEVCFCFILFAETCYFDSYFVLVYTFTDGQTLEGLFENGNYVG
jgi:hypothetical protein